MIMHANKYKYWLVFTKTCTYRLHLQITHINNIHINLHIKMYKIEACVTGIKHAMTTYSFKTEKYVVSNS